MFPTSNKPLSTLLRRGMDRAVEFATLGEYGIAETPQVAPRARRRPAPSQPWRPARTANQVVPATAAARRRGAEPQRVPAKRVSTRAAVRSLAMRQPDSSPAAHPRPRSRAGQPAPRPQPCISPLAPSSERR
jgi:hypothetical protein